MRMIDGSLLLKTMRTVQKECEKGGEEMGGESVLIAVGLDDACELVKSAPTVDPIKHGKWIKKIEEVSRPTCTVCGHGALLATNRIYAYSKYCPSCGAKMDLQDTGHPYGCTLFGGACQHPIEDCPKCPANPKTGDPNWRNCLTKGDN